MAGSPRKHIPAARHASYDRVVARLVIEGIPLSSAELIAAMSFREYQDYLKKKRMMA